MLVSAAATAGGTKGTNISAHGSDLPDECGGNGAHRRACRQEYGLQVRRHGLVHPGHLHFIVEIGAIAQTAYHDGCTNVARRLYHQPVKRNGLDPLRVVAELRSALPPQ